jgi:hypothetical protein
VVEMLHQHYKVQKRRAAINDERNVEKLFMQKYVEMADTESEDDEDDDAEEQDVDPAMEVVEYYRQVVATYTDDTEDAPAKVLSTGGLKRSISPILNRSIS